jgi:hypothetical protein
MDGSDGAAAGLQLRTAIEQAIVADAGIATRGAGSVDELFALIDASGRAADICAGLQRTAVEQARRSGASWAAIGDLLGISRQAAHQRFGSDDGDGPDAAGTRRIYGATAFNEMRILADEGAAGNHLVDFGGLYLVMRPSTQAWEHRREVALNIAARRAKLERAGWTYVGAWFPFHYFKRVRS